MERLAPLENVFVKEGLPGLSNLDSFGLRLSVHDSSLRTLQIAAPTVEGRLLISGEEPRRVVVVATDQFNLAGSADSLMKFCHVVDETVSAMMAYAYSPERRKWL